MSSCDQNIIQIAREMQDLINVSAGKSISVDKRMINGVLDFKVNYNPYQEAIISLSATPATAEVGRTIPVVNFVGAVTKGSADIVSKSISPQSIPDNELDSNFVFSLSDVFRNTAGLGGLHTITVDDGVQEKTLEGGVNFVWRHYTGLSTQDVIANTDGFQSQLAPYAEQDYNISENGSYIYWLRQQDEEPITRVSKGGFDFGITEISPISITNQYAISTTYRVWRTSNKLNIGSLEGLLIS